MSESRLLTAERVNELAMGLRVPAWTVEAVADAVAAVAGDIAEAARRDERAKCAAELRHLMTLPCIEETAMLEARELADRWESSP